MRRGRVEIYRLARVAILAAMLPAASTSEAAVVVLANATSTVVHATVSFRGATAREVAITPGDAVSVRVAGQVNISFDGGDGRRRYALGANAIYYFARKGGKLILHQASFSPEQKDQAVEAQPQAGPGAVGSREEASAPIGAVKSFLESGVVPVMVLVDDEERAAKPVWQERLRERVHQASKIIEDCCGIQFRVVATGTWNSDDGNRDFSKALREFELHVIPAPAALAIGFTSQHELPTRQGAHVDGVRGPMLPHVLVPEGLGNVSEVERLEMLVHELGHYLGAVHCPDSRSVMRPNVCDGRARAREFQIRFDAVNILVMNLVGEEMQSRTITQLCQLSPAAKRTLREIFAALAQGLPGDMYARNHLEMLDRTPVITRRATIEPDSLVGSTRKVIETIVGVAEWNRRNPKEPGIGQNAFKRVTGDDLTELYFRRAAAGAQFTSPDLAPKAFLLGLAVALDGSSLRRSSPLMERFCRQVESDSDRQHRLRILGSPTMRGRRDLVQRFAVSCGLAVFFSPRTGETIGMHEQLCEMQTGSGLSFADLAADVAGIVFAERVCEEKLSLFSLECSFTVDDFLPRHHRLSEDVSFTQFVQSYGSMHGDRFMREMATIRRRVFLLPGYLRSLEDAGNVKAD